MKKPFTSEYFDFWEWEKCFERWEELQPVYGGEIRLTIASKFYVSGYWIEALHHKTYEGDFLYQGKEVDELKKRIIEEHETAKKEGRGVQFTI